MCYTDQVIKVCLFVYCYLSKLTSTKIVIYLKNQTEKTETVVFVIKTNRNQTGKLKPLRP